MEKQLDKQAKRLERKVERQSGPHPETEPGAEAAVPEATDRPDDDKQA